MTRINLDDRDLGTVLHAIQVLDEHGEHDTALALGHLLAREYRPICPTCDTDQADVGIELETGNLYHTCATCNETTLHVPQPPEIHGGN